MDFYVFKTTKRLIMKFSLLLFLMFTVLISCSSQRKLQNFNVTSYKKVNSDYQYGREKLKFKENVYTPILTVVYSNEKLVSLLLFKSEGGINYSAKDLDADTVFKKLLNIPDIRTVAIYKQIIEDNKVKYPISGINKDAVFSIRNDSLFIYNKL